MNKNNIVIVGNGFDLAIGLPTTYAQFVNNKKYWPITPENAKDHSDESLYNYILQYTDKQKDSLGNIKWVDLEELLLQYAQSKQSKDISFASIQDDRETYELMKRKLHLYLINVVNPIIGEKSGKQIVVKKVFDAIKNSMAFSKVYSFNYTPTKNILKETFGMEFNVRHIHGRAHSNNDSIILGINDKIEIPEQYDFLQKSMDPSYQSHSLSDDLMASDEIILYGLSLGEADLMYFGEFFSSLVSTYEPGKTTKKNIHIFTYNQCSKKSILRNIKKYAKVNISSLYSAINLNIYAQDPDWDCPCNGEMLYEKFFKRMQDITPIIMESTVHTFPQKSNFDDEIQKPFSY